MKTIYLDNNATTAVAQEALAAALPFVREDYFNPSSMYEQARGPAAALARSREQAAALLGGVAVDELIFTGGATESNNMAVWGAIRANPRRRHIVTSAVEHPSVLETVRDADRAGFEVDIVPVDRAGRLDTRAFVRALRRDTLLVTIMHANNETGVVFPVGELARIVKETDGGILFHTDATQSVDKLAIDLKGDLRHVDLLSFSGHKLHAPKGVGALFMRRGTRCRALLTGGHQERGLRAGTENVAWIVALGEACRLATTARRETQRVEALRDRLEAGFKAQIPWLEINGAEAPRLPNTLNLACHCIEGESILYELSAQGICASSGSACTSGSLDPSHVLKAMQIPFTAMHGSVRFSLSRYTTDAEIDHVLAVFPAIVARLRCASPYWDAARQAPREGAGGAR